jgi:CheY-like chemotaxis protein
VSLLLIDLQMPGLDIAEFSRALNNLEADSRPHCVGYAQHVEIDLLKSAREAGIDEVYTRGQMNGGLDTLFAQHASMEERQKGGAAERRSN